MRAALAAAALVVGLVALATPGAAKKESIAEAWEPGQGLLVQLDDRRRPGEPLPEEEEEALPEIDPNAVPPPRAAFPRESIPVPDRWRLVESIGVNENLLDPYGQNTLKADRPLFDDWFVNLSVISDSVIEPRSFPVPVGIQTTEDPGSNALFGDIDQLVLNENLVVSVSFIKGDTVFRPPDYEFRITPIININRVEVEERRVLFADPTRGTKRTDRHFAIQEWFLDYHMQNVSDRFDFDSVRFGIQPIQSDFRGFLFQDQQFGVRFFGTRANNIFQYNVAWFRRIEKDTNSGLNDITKQLRDDDVWLANIYWQDFPVLGFMSQATYILNDNRETSFFFNTNEFLERPTSFGDERPHSYRVHYLGLSGDGHFGRVNLTGSYYYAFGTDDKNPFSSKRSDIRAWFAAAEASVDYSWIRVRGSAAYASGDDVAFDDEENGFDAIFENPQFAGADTSFWIRQQIPLIGGGGVGLSSRNAMLPSLRTSKEHGQSNFNNPGFTLVGIGADFDLTPEFRISANANKLGFADTESLEFLRNQGDIARDIGYDVSFATIYRPFFTQNIVARLSGAMLFPGEGFRDLFETRRGQDEFYSILANIILTY